MNRKQLLLGSGSVLLAAALVVIVIDAEEPVSGSILENPTPTSEEQTAQLFHVFVTQVIAQNLRPEVVGFTGTRVLEGTRGTATIRRAEVDGKLTLRMVFDAYSIQMTSTRADEYEIRVHGLVEYTRSTSRDGPVRVWGDKVHLGRLDSNRLNPFIDVAGTFTFDLTGSGPDTLMGTVDRATGERLTLSAWPVPREGEAIRY